MSVNHLTKLMVKLDLNADDIDIDLLTNMFKQLQVSHNDTEIDDLICQITNLEIKDDEVILEINNKMVILLKVYNCAIADYKPFSPTWGSAY